MKTFQLKDIKRAVVDRKSGDEFLPQITHADNELASIQVRSMEIGYVQGRDSQSSIKLAFKRETLAKILVNAIDDLRKNKLEIVLKARQSGMVHNMTTFLADSIINADVNELIEVVE